MESANIESHPVHVGLTKGPISKYHQHMILQVKFPTNRLSFPETHSNRNITDEKPCSPLLPLEHLPDYCLQAQTHLSDFLDSVHHSMCTSVADVLQHHCWDSDTQGWQCPSIYVQAPTCTQGQCWPVPRFSLSPQCLAMSGSHIPSHPFLTEVVLMSNQLL